MLRNCEDVSKKNLTPDTRESAMANGRNVCRVLHGDSKALVKLMEKEYDRGRTQLAFFCGEALPDGPLKAKYQGVWGHLIRLVFSARM